MSSHPEKSSSIRRQLGKEAHLHASQTDAANDFSIGSERRSPESGSFGASDLFSSSSVRSGSAALLANEDKTVISKHSPGKDNPAPVPVGPLDSRTTLEGMTLDHFRLDSFVGGGGMGAVFRGFDTRLNRLVAVKILSRDQADQETIKRFQNEAQNTARLDHPHIARVYYIGEDKGWNFIVFEFIEGVNLRDRVDTKGALSHDEALGFTLQIAEALDHAQARDVVHRDIKPSNVLVSTEGLVKLVDMGLARLHQVNGPSEDLTASGVTLGTFDYISPEQARDPRSADVRSDIYSLGCTLYFMLAGRPPFPEGTALQKLLWHTGEEPPDIRLFRPDVPEAICALLSRMMAKRPEQRFQTAGELIEKIIQISQHLDWPREHSTASLRAAPWPAGGRWSVEWQSYLPFMVILALLLVILFWPEASMPESMPTALALPNVPALNRAEEQPTNVDAASVGNGVVEPSSVESSAKSQASARMNAEADKLNTSGSNQEAGTNIAPISQSSNAAANEKSNSSPGNSSPEAPIQLEPTNRLAKNIIVVEPETETDKSSGSSLHPNVFTTFSAATRYATLHPEIDTVELAFDGRLIITERIEFPHQPIKVRAQASHRPLLQFHIQNSNTPPLIAIAGEGSVLSWENVQFEFVANEPGVEQHLFQIAGQSTLEFQSCVLTALMPGAINSGMNSPVPKVILFHCLEAPIAASAEEEEDTAETPPTRIVLKNSVIRGDVAICSVRDDYPLRMSISDSFVATKFQLLETGGAATKPRWMDRIRLSVQNSTLVCEEGVVLAGNRSTSPHRMEIRLQMNSNLIVTSRDRPLIEYRGGETGDEARMSFDGNGNFYPRTFTFLRRIVQQDGLDSSYDTSMGDLPRWAEDRNSEQGQLASSIGEIPHAELLPSDVALKSPGASVVGCRVETLPPLEKPKPRTLMGATNMESTKVDMPSTLMPPMMDEKSANR